MKFKIPDTYEYYDKNADVHLVSVIVIKSTLHLKKEKEEETLNVIDFNCKSIEQSYLNNKFFLLRFHVTIGPQEIILFFISLLNRL